MKNNKTKKLYLIIVFSVFLLLYGCGNKAEKEPEKNPTEVPVSEAVTSSPTATPESTATPTPSPSPSPTPLPKHYGHETVKTLDCLTDEGTICGLNTLPDGKLLALTESDSSGKENILIIDPEKNEIVKRGVTQRSDEIFKGYNPDRGYVFSAGYDECVHIYSDDLLFVEEIETGSECIYSPEGDFRLDNSFSTIMKKGLDGSEEKLLDKAYYTGIELGRAFPDFCIISAPGHYNNEEREYLKLSYDGSFSRLCEGNYSCTAISKNCFMGIKWQENDNSVAEIYGLSDGKLRGEYLLDYMTEFTASDSADFTFATVRDFDDANGVWQLKYYLLNPEDGSTTDAWLIENVCSDYSDYDSESEHWFVAVTTKEGNRKQSKKSTLIYEICSEDLEFANRLDYAESENRDPVFGKAGKSHEKIREKADELEKKYGITILIGNEIEGWHLSDFYVPVSTEDPEAYGSYDTMFTETALSVLEDGLAYYPEGFFDCFKDFRNEGGVRLVLVDALRNKNGSFLANGENTHFGLWNNIIIDVNSIQYITLHHELWHAVEYIIECSDPDAFNEANWLSFNPRGFKYVEDFDNYSEMSEKYSAYIVNPWTPEDSYFGRDYGMVNSKEDRATLVESFIGPGREIPEEYDGRNLEYLELFPHVKLKMDYMSEMCKLYFGMRYW